MVEYALILITIVIVVLAAALVLGPITNGKFVDVDTCINDATTC